MKKTVIFDFPDNFKFPKHFMQKNIRFEYKDAFGIERAVKSSACETCTFYAGGDEEPYCFLLGDEEGECPFYRGQKVVNYDD